MVSGKSCLNTFDTLLSAFTTDCTDKIRISACHDIFNRKINTTNINITHLNTCSSNKKYSVLFLKNKTHGLHRKHPAAFKLIQARTHLIYVTATSP